MDDILVLCICVPFTILFIYMAISTFLDKGGYNIPKPPKFK